MIGVSHVIKYTGTSIPRANEPKVEASEVTTYFLSPEELELYRKLGVKKGKKPIMFTEKKKVNQPADQIPHTPTLVEIEQLFAPEEIRITGVEDAIQITLPIVKGDRPVMYGMMVCDRYERFGAQLVEGFEVDQDAVVIELLALNQAVMGWLQTKMTAAEIMEFVRRHNEEHNRRVRERREGRVANEGDHR